MRDIKKQFQDETGIKWPMDNQNAKKSDYYKCIEWLLEMDNKSVNHQNELIERIFTLEEENERLKTGFNISSVDGARAYLESQGVDIDASIKKGLKEIDIIRLAGNIG